MSRFFAGIGKKTPPGKAPIIVVSGLPRSGTSMMMKILAAGGLPVLTDDLRVADPDNPNGYFELETVKQLPVGNVAWLAEARGKAVKVISSLLEFLPSEYSYKIIFMEREMHEILASQRRMLERRDEKNELDDPQIAEQFRKHLSLLKPWLARQPHMEVLTISYNELMSNPEPSCRQVIEFVSCGPLALERMLSVPNKELYRNRAHGSQALQNLQSTNEIINQE